MGDTPSGRPWPQVLITPMFQVKREADLQLDYRQHCRVPVLWRVVFYSDRLFAHGTVLDISPKGWRIASLVSVPTDVNMKLRVWPRASQYQYLEIEEATVLWVKEHQFAIAITRLCPKDEETMFELEKRTMGFRLTVEPQMRFS